MKKSKQLLTVFLLIFFFARLEFCHAQKQDDLFHDAGFYNTIQWTDDEPTLVTPQAWIYIKDFYFEARYNYENRRTGSLYFGRSFMFGKKAEIEIIPIIGGVFGKTNGISAGFNFQLDYKRFSTFTQCQYTLDFKDIYNSFFWDWTGFNITIYKYFGVGGSVQIFQPNTGEPFYRVSPMISFKYKTLALEAYSFNFWQQHPIWAIGMEYTFD